MSTNLYAPGQPLMINSGTFWRCRHGHTAFIPCVRCGVFHPVRYVVDRMQAWGVKWR